MLLEWGHSVYVDNNGEVQNNNFSLAEEFLSATPAPEVTDINSNQQAIYRSIEKGAYIHIFDCFFSVTFILYKRIFI